MREKWNKSDYRSSNEGQPVVSKSTKFAFSFISIFITFLVYFVMDCEKYLLLN